MPERKILIVGPSWVGDMVMAQSLFKVLKQRHPTVVIDVLAPAWSRPLLERMPEVRRAIDMPLGHGQLQLGLRRSLGVELRPEKYDQAILLPNSLKSALTPYFARIPQRTGFIGEMRYGLLNDHRKLDKQTLSMTVQRFVSLADCAGAPLPDPIPAPCLTVADGSVDAAIDALDLVAPQGPVLGLCPGAEYGAAKRWPENYYTEVAQSYIAKGWRVWLFGSDKDTAVTCKIANGAGSACDDLAGKTSLAQAIDLMSRCDAVVSNDSGLMHVAAALNRPLVAVYGSSDPGFTPPLNERARVLDLALECSPCFERECPLGHLNCLVELMPEQVISALDDLCAS